MKSDILPLASRLVTPLLYASSLVVLLMGHNAPGGGFIGGLMAASAYLLDSFARGPGRFPLDPRTLIGLGLLLACGSATAALWKGQAFFTGLWWEFRLGPLHLELGTPVLFDGGVYLVVAGTLTIILNSLLEGGS